MRYFGIVVIAVALEGDKVSELTVPGSASASLTLPQRCRHGFATRLLGLTYHRPLLREPARKRYPLHPMQSHLPRPQLGDQVQRRTSGKPFAQPREIPRPIRRDMHGGMLADGVPVLCANLFADEHAVDVRLLQDGHMGTVEPSCDGICLQL